MPSRHRGLLYAPDLLLTGALSLKCCVRARWPKAVWSGLDQMRSNILARVAEAEAEIRA